MTDEPAILGSGHFVPGTCISNNELEDRWQKPSGWITDRTGVRERRKAGEKETTGTMAVRAGEAAIRDAGVDPERIEMTLLATSTPDKPLPPTAPSVQDELNVSGGAFDIAGSCVGFLDALSTGAQYVRGETHQYVLVVASNHLTYRVNWSDPTTACLFGDGAGAVVLGRMPSGGDEESEERIRIDGVKLGSDGSVDSLDVPAGGSKEPFTPEAWERDRHLMRMKDGREIFKWAVRKQVDTGNELLDRFDLRPRDVDWLIPHQANLKIMHAVAGQLNVPVQRLLTNIERYGNTSAASIPIMLDEAWTRGVVTSGDRLLSTAFGCGIRFGAALMSCR